MDCTGNIQSIVQDFESKGILVTLSLADVSVQELQTLKAMDKLSVMLKKWHKKRSLDANAYCWVLITKIAEAVKSSKEEIYEQMLQQYGFCYKDDNGYITITVKTCVDMSKIGGHWMPIKDNGTWASYLMIKGSSEYDSAEMAHFIDCIVTEAKELGIQTETPDEIARMKSLWGKK